MLSWKPLDSFWKDAYKKLMSVRTASDFFWIWTQWWYSHNFLWKVYCCNVRKGTLIEKAILRVNRIFVKRCLQQNNDCMKSLRCLVNMSPEVAFTKCLWIIFYCNVKKGVLIEKPILKSLRIFLKRHLQQINDCKKCSRLFVNMNQKVAFNKLLWISL